MSAVIVMLQQGGGSSPQGNTTPPGGDTVGYWQQRVTYTITARLDEREQRVRSRGTLRYVNNSPDTLREMYVHQYLNAFRPGSKWSEVDEREGRDRFQHLQDPDYGYERFTAPVRVNDRPVVVDYPGAPDSTVAHFRLPLALAPHDSLTVAFEWDARPSTVPRRQGRRGRHWDLAQWYPKVAVYDRGGWEYNALQPAGEFYGEFGTYDVTLVLANDQVIGATGVPVAGDPGWSRALRNGAARLARDAYRDLPPPPLTEVGAGERAIRFVARDVHHFAWTASPDYRYEGGVYTRSVPGARFPTWDTVSIHALYRAGDDTSWGGLKVVQRTINALRWLESVYGPYAYPQMTVLHRLDGGGTEFPMMQMNGSPSQGLILHEGGHVFTYGILANNEWRSGWMDEGLTSYQTEWAQGSLPQERVRLGVVDQRRTAPGYRAHGIQLALPRFEEIALDQAETDMRGDAQPIGTVAQEFRDFNVYNDMIYTRAQVMYGQLRDVLGDSVFVDFLHDYYARWALKHVDELAMRASAERVSGRDLAWFFDQWVHRTGLVDYRLRSVRTVQDSASAWVTDAEVERKGEYRHRIAVGVRTDRGWTLGNTAHPLYDRETVRIATAERPLEVRLDPFHYSWDWDRRDDGTRQRNLLFGYPKRYNFDWPFLVQADREREVALWRPMAWYSRNGGLTAGLRIRSSYLGWLDQSEVGFVVATRRSNLGSRERYQFWTRSENSTLGRRPHIGWRSGGAWLDDILKLDAGYRSVSSTARRSTLRDIAVTWTGEYPFTQRDSPGERILVPELWDPGSVDLAGRMRWQFGARGGSYTFAEPKALVGVSRTSFYTKSELAIGRMQVFSDGLRLAVRGYGGIASGAPPQRALLLSANDPVSTFENHWWRPADALLKQRGVNWLPLGGAALRGFRWDLADEWAVGGNADGSRRILSTSSTASALGIWMHAFVDAATTRRFETLTDAGVGFSVSGRLYDRNVVVRLDLPLYVSDPPLSIDRSSSVVRDSFSPRWVVSFNDIW